MALLHAVWSLRQELDLTVSAAHYNHNLRGEESRRDEDFVRSYCEANGIPLEIGRGDVRQYAKTHHIGIETAARDLRYQFLQSLPGKIATAHTAQDNLETVLIRLLRGSGLRGLTGIPAERGNILRPMLDVSREEISAYLAENSIPHVEDSTNAEDDCTRNRLRHYVVPLLEQENPAAAQTVSRVCRSLRADNDFLDQAARTALDHSLQEERLSCGELLKLPEALQYRVLALFLEQIPELGWCHLDAARSLCTAESPSASLSLPGRWTLQRIYGSLALCPPPDVPASPLPPTDLMPGQTVTFGPWRISCSAGPAPKERAAGLLVLRSPESSEKLTLRPRREGARIVLPGGTKKVSRLMIDKKVPAVWRSTMPILCCGNDVLAVLPLAVAAPYRPKPGNDSILLYIKRMEESL